MISSSLLYFEIDRDLQTIAQLNPNNGDKLGVLTNASYSGLYIDRGGYSQGVSRFVGGFLWGGANKVDVSSHLDEVASKIESLMSKTPSLISGRESAFFEALKIASSRISSMQNIYLQSNALFVHENPGFQRFMNVCDLVSGITKKEVLSFKSGLRVEDVLKFATIKPELIPSYVAEILSVPYLAGESLNALCHLIPFVTKVDMVFCKLGFVKWESSFENLIRLREIKKVNQWSAIPHNSFEKVIDLASKQKAFEVLLPSDCIQDKGIQEVLQNKGFKQDSKTQIKWVKTT